MDKLISEQAAIDALEKSRFPGAPYIDTGIQIALREIKALESAQPEPCEDAVSRKLMYELGATCMARRDENGELVALGRLDMLPPAQPEIIHCRDCRHHGTAICRIWSRYGTINTPGYGFCYRAERKEQDETD